MKESRLVETFVLCLFVVGGVWGRYLCPSNTGQCTCQTKTKGLVVQCENSKKEIIVENLKTFKQQPGSIISYLTLRQNDMSHLPNYIFMGLDIRHLIISNTNLAVLETNSLSALEEKLGVLDLPSNLLAMIPSKAISHLPNTRLLNMNHNNITLIPANAFDGMGTLGRLSLYANSISRIDPNAFKGVEKELTSINLGANKLTAIPIKALSKLKNLVVLEIHENQISSIRETDFSGLSNLDTLKLGHNQLKELGPNVFRTLPRLSSLDLEFNSINKIDDRAFDGMEEKLEWLKLGNNLIQEIPSDALRDMHRLREFDLKTNNISDLTENSFEGFGNTIRFLYLQNNRIDSLPLSVFSDMHSLEHISISNNSIKSLPAEVFQPIIENIMVIDVHANPLNCDCSLQWYKQWLLKASGTAYNEKVRPIVLKAKCWSPKDKHEYMIKNAPIEQIYCPQSTSLGRRIEPEEKFSFPIKAILFTLMAFY